ncbi:YhjD/YihY/BrkB family envelope integrity protein [Nonomuraea soli]|uniref:Membrane protein n=1 Tax=Nonomuraea soli TaxID=1032476 RepID=A0A7W0HQK3_9ACTN|nr:YhjD/YihY/BrkB family envelope integrity protein [Nonomuraea soli]MBA2892029.1 membrane protein [Nonomuraea soli]
MTKDGSPARAALAALVRRLRTGPLSRLLVRLAHVRPTESAFVLAAQLFLSVFPLLLIITVITPDAARGIIQTMKERLGLEGEAAGTIKDLLYGTQDSGHGAITVISVIVALISATSFTRALQRLYERSWQIGALGLRGSWRGAVWLLGFLGYMEIIFLSSRLMRGTPLESLVSLLWGVLLWWWTPYLLLGGRVRWRALLPTALLSMVSMIVLSVVSAIYMPIVLDNNERRYGLIGVVFALESWLAVVCGALVGSAVLGALAAQSDGRIGRLVRGVEPVDGWRRDTKKKIVDHLPGDP